MYETKLPKKSYDRVYSDKELLGRFWRYLTTYESQLIIVIILILLLSGLNVIPPLMVQRAYDKLELSNEWTTVAPYAIAYV
nr:hypothetical protein [Asgard group archaeon]